MSSTNVYCGVSSQLTENVTPLSHTHIWMPLEVFRSIALVNSVRCEFLKDSSVQEERCIALPHRNYIRKSPCHGRLREKHKDEGAFHGDCLRVAIEESI